MTRPSVKVQSLRKVRRKEGQEREEKDLDPGLEVGHVTVESGSATTGPGQGLGLLGVEVRRKRERRVAEASGHQEDIGHGPKSGHGGVNILVLGLEVQVRPVAVAMNPRYTF